MEVRLYCIVQAVLMPWNGVERVDNCAENRKIGKKATPLAMSCAKKAKKTKYFR